VKPRATIRKALSDRALLGSVLDGTSWQAWCVLLIAAMGEALAQEERALFAKLTGREREPGQRVEEFVAVVGRRGGKSRAMATLACYIAGLCDHPLVRGERGVVLCIAPDQRQAAITLDYATAAFEASPILRQLIANKTAEALELTNRITIEVRAASFRRLRGPTYVAVIADEAAFWHSDEGLSANPDTEIVNAVRPGLATTGGPLIIASSPYARKGILWDAFRRHYGATGDPLILVAKGTSRDLNPSLPQRVIDRALERDHAAASAEYLAEFRSDLEAFVAREVVQACVSAGVHERPPLPSLAYRAFCDPSGGSSDSMTLAIGHNDHTRQTVVIDALREARPPFSPEQVVQEFAAVLKSYRVHKIQGDKYAGAWPTEQFGKFGIRYEASAKPKSDLYVDLLARLNSARVDLLDHPRLISQLCALERRTARGGRDSIDHAPGGHDDLANSVAGLSGQLAHGVCPNLDWISGPPGGDDPAEEARRWRVASLMRHIERYG
jgi:hypothetical protein